jgi:actin-related protein
MTENTEIGSKIRVTKPNNAIESTWNSMSSFYSTQAKEMGNEVWITKKEYDESGVNSIVKTHCMGNRY